VPAPSPTQVKILVPGNHLMVGLLGQRDELLRLVQDAFPVEIHVRGNEITIRGDEVEADRVGRLFEEMVALLEAGHVLDLDGVGRSIQMLKADQRPTEVLTTEVLRGRKPVRIETWRPPELDRRVASVEGVGVARQAKLAEHVGLAWLTPAQDRLLQDPPSARRRFLDRLVLTSAPEHAARTSAYERALRERSTLLRAGGRDRVWLDVIERRMSEAGVAIAAARLETVAALNAQLDRLDTSFPRPMLEVVGSCESALAEAPALEVEEQMMADLRRARAGDALAGGASCGPHRSDLDLIDAETGSPAQSCSTGRQKSLLVSIVLAQALLRRDRLGAFPILLLDEIAAHLDARRRDALFVFLASLGIQAWLSGTDAHAFHALAGRATFFLVNDGRLTAYD
jgi:DNA replication and repair protein RecF